MRLDSLKRYRYCLGPLHHMPVPAVRWRWFAGFHPRVVTKCLRPIACGDTMGVADWLDVCSLVNIGS